MFKTISYSKMFTFLTCARKYRYIYLDKIKRPPLSKMVFGSSNHETQEYASKEQIKSGNRPKVKDQFDHYASVLDKNLETGIIYDDGDDKDKMQKDGFEAIEEYDPVGRGLVPMSVEKWFQIGFKEKDWVLNGKIDLITKEGVIIDHKFGKRSITGQEPNIQTQLVLYGIGSEEKVKSGFQIHSHIRGAKKDKFKIIDVVPYLSESTVANHIIETANAIQSAEQTDCFPMCLNQLACSWCQYRDLCGLPVK